MIFNVLGVIIFLTGLYQLIQCFKHSTMENNDKHSEDYKKIILAVILMILGVVIFTYKLRNVNQQNPPNRTKISVSISKKEIKVSSRKAKKAQQAAIKRGSIASHVSSTELSNQKANLQIMISDKIPGKEKLRSDIESYSKIKLISSVNINHVTTIRLNKHSESLTNNQLDSLNNEIIGQFTRWTKQYNVPSQKIVIYNNSGKIIR